MKITITIADETIRDLLITAQEHCGYWCRSDRDLIAVMAEPILIHELADDGTVAATYEFGPLMIRTGLTSMAAVSPHQFGEMLRDGADADTADVFLQCCLFGEVRYS